MGENRSSIFLKKDVLNFQIYVLGLTYLQVGQVLLISCLSMISFPPRNERKKPKDVKHRMNFAKASPGETRSGKDNALLLSPMRFLNCVFSYSVFFLVDLFLMIVVHTLEHWEKYCR